MKNKYIIQDWAGNVMKEKAKSGLLVDLEFNDFEDAWAYLYEKHSDLNEEQFDEQMGEFEVLERG